MEVNKIIQGDCLEVLKTLPSESVDCVVTSPPYWALRDYGVDGQLGLEPTFQEYINKLCDIFDEVKRVLKKSGTCWVNMGDTYTSHSIGQGNVGGIEGKRRKQDKNYDDNLNAMRFDKRQYSLKQGNHSGRGRCATLPDKSLCQIPSRFAIEMSNRGWILRNEIIWHKPNCMPSSVKDRFTVDFEKVFFFVKSKKYWFETQYEKSLTVGSIHVHTGINKMTEIAEGVNPTYPQKTWTTKEDRNKRCVWTITTKPFKEAHFATYPEALIEPMIKAGCPVGGLVLDPFLGSGTTAVACKELGRNYIGIELNPEYVKIAEERLKGTTPSMFNKLDSLKVKEGKE